MFSRFSRPVLSWAASLGQLAVLPRHSGQRNDQGPGENYAISVGILQLQDMRAPAQLRTLMRESGLKQASGFRIEVGLIEHDGRVASTVRFGPNLHPVTYAKVPFQQARHGPVIRFATE